MIKYLRKSDWGDYWASDSSLDDKKLVERAEFLISKLGVQISEVKPGDSDDEIVSKLFRKTNF